jgi:plasmid stabilization system protein ParE
VGILADHPHVGGLLPEDDSDTYRELIQGNYRMIYRIEGQRVLIVAVHHASFVAYRGIGLTSKKARTVMQAKNQANGI